MTDRKKITMGSLFSGSGGFELAGEMYGIEPLWASEIEPFPVLVTTKRFPNMKHYGDVNSLNGAELEPVDILTGGSPCQDMSIAGKREGLEGERSTLFHQQIRIVKEMREKHGKPRYMVWENVPGAFSSGKGEDFRTVLEEIARVKQPDASIPGPEKRKTGGMFWNTAGSIMGDGYSIAWRVFDAQFWGVPQRRKRIYLVADFDGGSAAKILFKPESLQWDFEKGAEAWESAAGCPENSAGETGRNSCGGGYPIEYHPQDSRIQLTDSGIVQTLTGKMGTGGGNVPLVLESPEEGKTAMNEDTRNPLTIQERVGKDGGGKGILIQENVSAALRAAYRPVVCETIPIADKATRYKGGGDTRHEDGAGNGLGVGEPDAPSYTLTAADRHAVAVAYAKQGYDDYAESDVASTLKESDARRLNNDLVCDGKAMALDCRNSAVTVEKSGTLQAKGNGGHSLNYQNPVVVPDISGTLTAKMAKGTGGPAGDECQNLVAVDYIVRRLTPLECGRLQGFPDGWTENLAEDDPDDAVIDYWEKIFEEHRQLTGSPKTPRRRSQIVRWLKEPYSDTALYKMWGNGIALPCAAFVMKGIAMELMEEPL